MIDYITKNFNVSKNTVSLVQECETELTEIFNAIKETAQLNQFKVISAFRAKEVSTRHFTPSTGYGYGDIGREMLCEVFAEVFGTQSAIVSPMLMSGTHAISTALFGILRPKDSVLSITGMPYDTLLSTICGTKSSLEAYNINFKNIALVEGKIDLDSMFLELNANANTKLVYIQRSTGYDLRSAFTSKYIGDTIAALREKHPKIIVMVDNCYGEFVNLTEPSQVGANIIAGSLIKNPGGGIAPTGGYIAGDSELMDLIAERFTVPGMKTEIGSYAYGYDRFFQGLFMAPHSVSQALMSVVLAARVFEKLGYKVSPAFNDERGDITQTIIFNNEDLLVKFVRGIQKASPIDSHVVPYPWDMPGYNNQVIMAAGTFVQGSSIELTADAPLREPYAAYLQGGLTYEHGKLGILYAVEEISK